MICINSHNKHSSGAQEAEVEASLNPRRLRPAWATQTCFKSQMKRGERGEGNELMLHPWRNTIETDNVKPLVGVKILDLTRVLAGPFATMNLGDLGAEVIKVERPGVGDDTRTWGPPFVGTESTYFLSVNRNKKSIAVNIKDPKGVKIVKELATVCDVFVENYVPGKLTAMGLGYEDVDKVAPHIVYCSITGYGHTGPMSQRAGYDAVASAISGMMHITGPEDGDPVRPGVAMTDLATGLYAYGAVMAGLIQRCKTGKGLFIDCNLLSSQAFKTKDGHLVVGAGNNQQFATLCKILNLPELIDDSKYKTNHLRVQNRKELIKILSARFEEEMTATWLCLFEGCGIPYGPINNMKGVFADPQVLHNGLIMEMNHPAVGKISVPEKGKIQLGCRSQEFQAWNSGMGLGAQTEDLCEEWGGRPGTTTAHTLSWRHQSPGENRCPGGCHLFLNVHRGITAVSTSMSGT
ncbi:succinate--hydroxymethylglutarate CoA-transferase isoform X4 [Heterocephalus glaber]|uniref:Succinyl-CoA:glutarate CoA-transferase n=1 Tax=Heterocephalus glaber TaxID=10181 RepID=A0AAX6SKZ6_HETGA|nr:succinate--hydroxymethylglutarate CoA-transferase isoform X4 [Heterocephalus glaber]